MKRAETTLFEIIVFYMGGMLLVPLSLIVVYASLWGFFSHKDQPILFYVVVFLGCVAFSNWAKGVQRQEKAEKQGPDSIPVSVVRIGTLLLMCSFFLFLGRGCFYSTDADEARASAAAQAAAQDAAKQAKDLAQQQKTERKKEAARIVAKETRVASQPASATDGPNDARFVGAWMTVGADWNGRIMGFAEIMAAGYPGGELPAFRLELDGTGNGAVIEMAADPNSPAGYSFTPTGRVDQGTWLYNYKTGVLRVGNSTWPARFKGNRLLLRTGEEIELVLERR
jgi:hypothetical protein